MEPIRDISLKCSNGCLVLFYTEKNVTNSLQAKFLLKTSSLVSGNKKSIGGSLLSKYNYQEFKQATLFLGPVTLG